MMLTYSRRIAKIKKSDDIDKQIKLAETAAQRFLHASRSARLSLDDKLLLLRRSQASRDVAMQLKRNYFDICDQLISGGQPLTAENSQHCASI